MSDDKDIIPTDSDGRRQAYETTVDALAWTFLYSKLRKIGPTTPLRELLSAAELELTGADPTIPVGDVLPREELAQGCRDACQRAVKLLDFFDVELEMRIPDLRPKPAFENVVARYLEILCDTISTHGSTRRGADFGGRELKPLMDAEIRRFLLPPGKQEFPLTSDNPKSGWWLAEYDNFTPTESRNLKLIHQMHWGWCHRAEKK